jgi:GH25 family lysozyme M1 (1,4-beta-N-acetylmuramidase)
MRRARHRRADGTYRKAWLRAGLNTCVALAAGALAASCVLIASGSASVTRVSPVSVSAASTTLNGIDVSSAQHPGAAYPDGAPINWADVAAEYQFAAIKATEGNYYTNPYYASDAAAAVAAGMYVAPYHFANPATANGTPTAQAQYAAETAGTVQNAPDYTVGGQYLPLMVDLEYNPYSATDGLNECYGLSTAQMVSWISAFMTEATTLTGAAPIIYTPTAWWNTCTGDSTAFGADLLWIPAYGVSTPGTLPAGWSNWTFWQYTSSGSVNGISGSVDLDYMSANAPAITSVDDVTLGTGVTSSFTVTATGFPAPTFSETGTLPAGVSFSSAGVLSGTPAGDTTGSYPIQVTATNGAGSATQAFTLTVDGTSSYVAMTPTRVLDTRNGTGGYSAPVGAGKSISLQVTGLDGVPTSGVSAVVLNVTATDPTASSYVTVYPDGQTRPIASNLNFTAGETIPNLVTVPVGSDGKIDFYNNSGSVNLVADLAGYYTTASGSGSLFDAASPLRVLDTRNGTGTGGTVAPVGPGGTISLQITGVGSVPATGVTAVVLNVTATNPTVSSYVTVYPDGQTRPVASNLNFTPGETIPNLVVVPVGADGEIDFYNFAGSVNLVADLAGYYTSSGTGSSFVPVSPSRLLDTRNGTGGVSSPVGPGGTISLQLASADGLPASGLTAVVLNVTATNPTASSYVTVYPDGTAQPTASNLNFTAGETIPNLVAVQVGADGEIDFYNFAGSTDLVADLAGYYTSS